MQDNRGGVRRTFRLGALFVALVAVVGGLFLAVTLFGPVSTTKVSAAQANDSETVSAEALSIALDFKSGSDYAVFGGKGLLGKGNVEIRGKAATAGRASGIAVASDLPTAGAARGEMRAALGFIGQLPCRSVDSADLGGRSFGPGVYCLSSANLAGEMTLDAGGNEGAVFVFRIAGDFAAGDGAKVSLAGGARAGNAYFVSSKAAIGANDSIDANVISDSDINVGSGSNISGKVFSVNGSVSAADAVLGPAQTGFIEICKDLAAGETRITPGTLFNFTVNGAGLIVPAGECSAPLAVPAGNVVVTEGARADTIVTNIRTTLGNGQAAPERLVTANLATRTATVAVPDSTTSGETIVRFTNATARTGFIEICKNGLDTAVTGPWVYLIPGNLAAGAPATVTVFTNSCSAPIAVTLPSQVATGDFFNVTVTELGRPTFVFDPTLTTTLPTGRVVSSVLNADNGGTVQVQVIAGGNTTNQTTVFFNNRSLPGRIKVCKSTIDPNITIGTRFQFMLSGITVPGGPTQQENLEVRAGPFGQIGFCVLSNLNYVVGSAVTIAETSVTAADLQPGITPDMIRVSTIFSSAPVVAGSTFIANPPAGVTPSPYARLAVIQQNTVSQVEFVNYVYRPAVLKICKTATGTIAPGTLFNFTVQPLPGAADQLRYPLAFTSTTVAVPAGGCVFASGPFPPSPNFDNGIGTWNFGTNILITEAAAGTTVVAGVTTPTGCTLTANPANRNAVLNLCNNALAGAGLFNEITFANAPAPVVGAAATRFDFDGDHSSDPVVFRPTDGTWYFAASSQGGAARGAAFGQAGDVPVAADFDGDGTTDYAVFRGGNWYILGSSSGFSGVQFGYGTDIPQPGDYDHDGKADIAVFRPSNGAWYILGSSSGFTGFLFGQQGDIPVAADYDGDGKTDAAVVRNGNWYVLGSQVGFYGFPWGLATDKPVPADYDGDGKADPAVVRDGTWYINRSQAGFTGLVWGLGSDIPVPADYDGDGKTDPAVFRPSTGTWYMTHSSSNAGGGDYSAMQFGASSDQLMRY